MFHLRKFSSAVNKVVVSRRFLLHEGLVKASPIYPKNNNNNMVVRPDQTRFLHEESKKNPAPAAAAAAGTLLDQISLRPFQLSDVDDMMLWATDEGLIRYCGWEEIGIKGIYSSSSREDSLEDLEKNIIPHPWMRAICLKNQPIGKIFVDSFSGAYLCRMKGGYGFTVEEGYGFRAKVSFVVASKHWGKGIATTALKMTLDTIFQDLPHLRRLEATVYVENLASQRLLEKAGFQKECVRRKYYQLRGRLVDAATFSYLSTDSKPPLLD